MKESFGILLGLFLLLYVVILLLASADKYGDLTRQWGESCEISRNVDLIFPAKPFACWMYKEKK